MVYHKICILLWLYCAVSKCPLALTLSATALLWEDVLALKKELVLIYRHVWSQDPETPQEPERTARKQLESAFLQRFYHFKKNITILLFLK